MALKNVMRVDNGNIVGADTEARNFINNNLITSVNGTEVEFKFIYDSTQDKFGYRDASGTFVPFESGGDFSQLIYENLAAANIKSGTTISVKDPDGNVLNSATGSYAVNTFTNLTAANVKKDVVVTVKDTDDTTVKTVTGTYTTNTFTNLTAANVKSGTTVTIKDTAGTTLKSVTGTYTTPQKNFKVVTYPFVSDGYLRCRLYVYNINNISSMTIVSNCTYNSGSYMLAVYKNGSLVAQTSSTSYTVTGLTNGSYINAYSGWESAGYGQGEGSIYIQVSSFS